MFQDLRYGMRMLVKNPVITAVAILSLALGIGANTAMFSLVDAMLLKMLPVKNPEQLVLLNWTSGPRPIMSSLQGYNSTDPVTGQRTSTSFSYPVFEQLRDRNQSLSDLFAFAEIGRLNVSIDGQAELASGQLVSGGYYDGLGVQPIAGRAITNEDDDTSAPPVAVVSYGYWKRRFGQDLSAVGRSINLNGNHFTIIGIAPPKFSGTLQVGTAPEITIPMAMQALVRPRGSLLKDSDYWWLQMIGRLKPNVTDQQARADLDVIFQQSLSSDAKLSQRKNHDTPQLEVKPGGQGLSEDRREYSEPLLILMSVVGLVLLIACANIANLLLARAASRQKEIAVRLALGASRLRLIRQLLTESVLLASIGGLFGLLLSFWGKDLIVSLLPPSSNSFALDLTTDVRVLAFTGAVSLLTGILFGLAPAFRATRTDLTSALKNIAGTQGRGGRRLSLSKALVVVQVALSLLLMIGAGLFVRTLQNLERVDMGFNPDNVLLFKIDPTLNGYKGERLVNLYDQIAERVRAVPGVRSVGMSFTNLIGGGSSTINMSLPGYTPQPGENMHVGLQFIGGDFFDAMEIPLLAGRKLGPQDNAKSAKVAVINQTMARTFFHEENPTGKRFSFGSDNKEGKVEVVGVVRDAKNDSLRKEIQPTAYIPYNQDEDLGRMSFEVRSAGDPTETVAAIRQAVQAIDGNLPLFDVRTQVEQINKALAAERLFATLSTGFGLLALLLACIGLYGIMSYGVARRTQEIGIRMALGARPGNILWLVLRETLLLVLIGVVLGVPAALATTQLISSMLFGLTPTDPATIAIAITVMLAVAIFAGYLPARRAARVDPWVALRYE